MRGLTLLAALFLALNSWADCFPTPSGLVGWWPGDGNANNVLGTNNGTLQGGATANAPGLVATAFNFDGTNGYISIPDSPALRPTNFTLEAWVKIDAMDTPGTANPGVQFFIFKQNSRANFFEGFWLGKSRATGADHFIFAVSSAAGVFVPVRSATIQTGVWYHVAAVRGPDYIQLYTNGQFAAQATVNFPQDYGNHPLYFSTSGQPSYDSKLKGNLDEVALYSRPLSSNEIAAIFAAGVTGKCKAPNILMQPQGQAITVGANVSFSVNATGFSPLNYHWRFNDNSIEGATNSSLTLSNVQAGSQGNYSVLVSNALGSILSSNAFLEVTAPQPGVPYISAVNPVTAAPGTTVNIAGFNFSPALASNIVYFGAVRTVVVAASATNLAVIVPIGATFSPLSVSVGGMVAIANSNFQPTFAGNGTPVIGTTFAAGQNLAGGVGNHRTVIADFDGDGKPDLAIANVYAHTISLFRNVGGNAPLSPASFAARVDFPALDGPSDNPYGFIGADVDGDGKLDIVFADRMNNRIGIYRNQSSVGILNVGSFTAPLYFSTGADPRYVRVADLDRDGRPDIVACNTGAGTISILRNIGAAGTLGANSFAPRVDLISGAGAYDVAIQDLDGDGRPDLAVVNPNTTTLSVFRNISMPGILDANSFAPRLDLPALSNVTIAAGDVDGDGRPDLIAGGASTAISIYRNVSTPGSLTTNSFASKLDFGNPGWVHNVALGDVNGDGKPEVVVVGELASFMRVYQNQSTPGNVSLAGGVNYATGWNAWGVSVGDLDGDSRSDIVFCNAYDNTVTLYRNAQPFGGPPVLLSALADFTVAVGNTMTFTVSAAGQTPLSYQWRFNGTNIAGATNAFLTLTEIQVTQAGDYSVQVSNALDFVTSSNAFLTVNLFPTCAAAPSGLVGWWPGNASAVDSAGTNHGALLGNTTYAAGRVGQAFNLDGSNDGVVVGNPASLQLQNFTIEAWVKRASPTISSLGSHGNALIFGYGSGGYGLGFLNNGQLFLTRIDIDNVTIAQGITDTNYHHVAVTKSGSTVFFYIDGAAYPAPVYNTSYSFGTSAAVGMRADSQDDSLWGTIDEVSVYNRPLSPGEIQSIYNSGSAGKCPVSPTFAVQPTPQAVAVGNVTTLSAYVEGTHPITYQWFFNGNPLLDGARTSGTMNSTLMITNAQVVDTGNYFLVASNVAGANTSVVATLTVGLPPAFVTQPSGQDVLVDSNFVLSVSASGSEPLACRWLFNGTPLVDDARRSGSTSFTLTVNSAVTNDTGNYFAIVSNAFGVVTSALATVSVWQPPMITLQPVAQTVPAGTNVTFTVNAIGIPTVFYQWQFKGTNLPGQTGPNLTLINVQAANAGDYSVVASNYADTVISDTATLVVTPVAPVFTVNPIGRTATKGAEVIFTAIANGSEPISYQWQLNGTNISGANTTMFGITNAQYTNAGIYALLATNSVGSTNSADAVLTVTPPPGFLWTRKGGSPSADEGRCVTRDAQGNIFVAGTFTGTATFGTNILQAVSDADIFLAKYDPAGQLLWARRAGSVNVDSANGIAVDADGNVCIVGSVGSTTNFGSATLVTFGGMDAYLAKYSGAGDLLWVTNFGGTTTDSANAVTTDGAGNIYLTGSFGSTGFFGGTIISNTLSSAVFTVKCNSDGSVNWVRTSGGSATGSGFGIVVDAQSNVLLAGSFSSSFITFGPIALTNSVLVGAAASPDVFIVKYDANGAAQWVRKAGGTAGDTARGIALDSGGNAYVVGDFTGTAAFGNTTFTAPGQTPDVFLMKLDPSGVGQWAQRAGGTSTDAGNSVTVDSGGNVFITGSYSLSGNFGGIYYPPPIFPNGGFVGGTNLANSGGTDAFVAMYTTAGEFRWALKAAGSSTDTGRSVVTDNRGGLRLSGAFSSSATFGHITNTAMGGTDFFLSKLVAFDADAPPLLVAQPVNQTNAAGSTVTLSAGVIAPDPIGYQWQFNGVDIPGATNVSLTLYSIVATNTGFYSVNITTPNGNLSSPPATLTVVVEPDFVWSKHIGGADNDECLAVATDALGNTYAAGYFSGTTAFGGTNLVSNGGEDVFVAKFDAAQNLTWVRQIGDTTHDRATALALDDAGNLVVAGQFTGSPDFGGTNLTSAGSNDVFLAKFDAAGALLWARQAGGPSADLVYRMAVHSNGDIALAGSFQRIADFSGVLLTNKNLFNAPSGDIFVARYDNAGLMLWVKGAGSSSEDRARGVAFDPAGNIIIAGGFNTGITFDNITLNSVRKSLEIFVTKYGPTGNVVWARAPGTAATDTTTFAFDDEATAVATDPGGNIFVTGYFQSLGIFGSNTVVSASTNAPDLFLTKYDDAGNLLWVRTGGGMAVDSALALTTDLAGNAFLAGSFVGPAQFGGGNIPGIGGTDAFAAMYDATGNLIKFRKAGGSGDDAAHALAYNGHGSVIVGGFHSGPAVIGAVPLPGSGGRDVFMTKLSLFDPDAAPFLTSPPTDQTILYGKTLDLGVGVLSGSPLDYQWLLNGLALSGATNASLRITNFQYAAAGGYSAVVSNQFGAATSVVAQVTIEITPEFPWLRRAGSQGDDQANALAMDAETNLYVGGYFSGTATFTNGFYGTNVSLVSTGFTDIFLAKYNAAGQLLWARQAGGNREDAAQAVAVDGEGNVFVTGYFRSVSARFGTTVLTNPGLDFQAEIFVAKFDSQGNPLWAKRAGGLGWDGAQALAVDGAGNAYLTGFCYWLATFGNITLTNGNPNFANISNYFVAKYNSSGDVIWARNAASSGPIQGNNGTIQGNGICLDASTNVIVTGNLMTSADFGNGSVITNSNSTTEGGTVFVVKYDRNGALLWARKGAVTGAGIGQSVRADDAGNIYGASSKISYGTSYFLTKYDAAGNVLWFRAGILTCCTLGTLGANSLAFDPSGNVMITGGVVENATLEGLPLSSSGFVAKYRPDGLPLWIMRAGRWGYGIVTDTGGNAYVAGRYLGTGFFGPTQTNILAGIGGNDIFLVKLGLNPPTATPAVAVKTIATDAGTTLQVTTTGTGPFAYQWRFNGTNIPGATGSSYLLNGAKWTNAGLYSVVISNTAGRFESGAAAVNVTPKLYSEFSGGDVLLMWGGTFTLQSSPNPSGPFADLPGAVSPHLYSTSNGPLRFFRLKSEPFALSLSNQPGVGLTLSGAGISGYNFIVLGSTNLSTWTPLATNISPFSFIETNPLPVQFYRAMMAQ